MPPHRFDPDPVGGIDGDNRLRRRRRHHSIGCRTSDDRRKHRGLIPHEHIARIDANDRTIEPRHRLTAIRNIGNDRLPGDRGIMDSRQDAARQFFREHRFDQRRPSRNRLSLGRHRFDLPPDVIGLPELLVIALVRGKRRQPAQRHPIDASIAIAQALFDFTEPLFERRVPLRIWDICHQHARHDGIGPARTPPLGYLEVHRPSDSLSNAIHRGAAMKS